MANLLKVPHRNPLKHPNLLICDTTKRGTSVETRVSCTFYVIQNVIDNLKQVLLSLDSNKVVKVRSRDIDLAFYLVLQNIF